MRGLIIAFCATFLFSACSSNGGGTSGGTGSIGVNAGSTGLIITAVLTSTNLSADTHLNVCSVTLPTGFTFDSFDGSGNVLASEDATGIVAINGSAVVVLEDGITTETGTIAISITDTGPATTPNKAINFTRYTVSYTSPTPGAPAIGSRTHAISLPVVLAGATVVSTSQSVLLVELDTSRPTFVSSNPAGTVFTYTVRVSITGTRLDTREVFTVSGLVSMELGDFDRC
ncbi:MAG: hypothetical protein ACI8P9_000658 [Parasphingorhabdus sp.]|jgi:hypothetical protein